MTGPEALDMRELARRNERLREQQDAISSVLRTVVRSAELQPVLDEVSRAARHLCDAGYASLYLAEGDVLVAASGDGGFVQWDYDQRHPHALDRSTLAGRAAVTRAVAHIPDIHADPEYAYTGPWGGYRAGIGVPVLFENELIGAISIVRAEPEPFTDETIQLIQTFADQAAITIANARLASAVERQRTELARYVPPQVAELLSSERGERLLAGHRAYVACLFCDLRGFTAFAETAAPEEVLDLLREYHALVVELIQPHDGTLEHFAGDGLMVFFNDPMPIDAPELGAVQTGLAIQERFHGLADTWRKRGSDIGLGIGIAAGYATLGRIGFEGRYDYAVVGPVANLAARLGTAARSGQTLVNQRVLAEIESLVETDAVGELELRGFARPVAAYAVLGLRAVD